VFSRRVRRLRGSGRTTVFARNDHETSCTLFPFLLRLVGPSRTTLLPSQNLRLSYVSSRAESSFGHVFGHNAAACLPDGRCLFIRLLAETSFAARPNASSRPRPGRSLLTYDINIWPVVQPHRCRSTIPPDRPFENVQYARRTRSPGTSSTAWVLLS